MGTKGQGTGKPVVLLVDSDHEDRDLYAAWLQEDGFEVLLCPGPTAPDYTCVGGRTGACPLAERAEVIVLDAELPGDVVSEGTSASDLTTLYASMGKPVLGMATLAREVPPPAEWVRSPASRPDLVSAVNRKLQARARQRPSAHMSEI